MKVSGFWLLFCVVGTALMFLSFSSTTTGSIPDIIFTHHGGSMTMTSTNRKLKEFGYHPSADKKKDLGDMNIEDYHPIDPVPSSKASIKPGPIEHGSPLIPYIPRPSPPGPGHPKSGGLT